MRSYTTTDFDTVFDSQRVFRCLLQASAQPGKLFTLPPFACSPVAASARTLLDHEVTFCATGGEAPAVEDRLSELTGARVSPVEEADFALISGGDSAGAVLRLKRGTLEHPERGATAIYAVEELSNSDTLSLELYGPGVPGNRTLGVGGVGAPEVSSIQETRQDYPLGIDVYLVDGAGRVAALPRSTRIVVGA